MSTKDITLFEYEIDGCIFRDVDVSNLSEDTEDIHEAHDQPPYKKVHNRHKIYRIEGKKLRDCIKCFAQERVNSNTPLFTRKMLLRRYNIEKGTPLEKPLRKALSKEDGEPNLIRKPRIRRTNLRLESELLHISVDYSNTNLEQYIRSLGYKSITKRELRKMHKKYCNDGVAATGLTPLSHNPVDIETTSPFPVSIIGSLPVSSITPGSVQQEKIFSPVVSSSSGLPVSSQSITLSFRPRGYNMSSHRIVSRPVMKDRIVLPSIAEDPIITSREENYSTDQHSATDTIVKLESSLEEIETSAVTDIPVQSHLSTDSELQYDLDVFRTNIKRRFQEALLLCIVKVYFAAKKDDIDIEALDWIMRKQDTSIERKREILRSIDYNTLLFFNVIIDSNLQYRIVRYVFDKRDKSVADIIKAIDPHPTLSLVDFYGISNMIRSYDHSQICGIIYPYLDIGELNDGRLQVNVTGKTEVEKICIRNNIKLFCILQIYKKLDENVDVDVDELRSVICEERKEILKCISAKTQHYLNSIAKNEFGYGVSKHVIQNSSEGIIDLIKSLDFSLFVTLPSHKRSGDGELRDDTTKRSRNV